MALTGLTYGTTGVFWTGSGATLLPGIGVVNTAYQSTGRCIITMVVVQENSSTQNITNPYIYNATTSQAQYFDFLGYLAGEEAGGVSAWSIDITNPNLLQSTAMTIWATLSASQVDQFAVLNTFFPYQYETVAIYDGSGSGTSANPSWTVTSALTSGSQRSAPIEGIFSGLTSMTNTPASGWNYIYSVDAGQRGWGTARKDNYSGSTETTLTAGWTAATSDDWVGWGMVAEVTGAPIILPSIPPSDLSAEIPGTNTTFDTDVTGWTSLVGGNCTVTWADGLGIDGSGAMSINRSNTTPSSAYTGSNITTTPFSDYWGSGFDVSWWAKRGGTGGYVYLEGGFNYFGVFTGITMTDSYLQMFRPFVVPAPGTTTQTFYFRTNESTGTPLGDVLIDNITIRPWYPGGIGEVTTSNVTGPPTHYGNTSVTVTPTTTAAGSSNKPASTGAVTVSPFAVAAATVTKPSAATTVNVTETITAVGSVVVVQTGTATQTVVAETITATGTGNHLAQTAQTSPTITTTATSLVTKTSAATAVVKTPTTTAVAANNKAANAGAVTVTETITAVGTATAPLIYGNATAVSVSPAPTAVATVTHLAQAAQTKPTVTTTSAGASLKSSSAIAVVKTPTTTATATNNSITSAIAVTKSPTTTATHTIAHLGVVSTTVAPTPTSAATKAIYAAATATTVTDTPLAVAGAIARSASAIQTLLSPSDLSGGIVWRTRYLRPDALLVQTGMSGSYTDIQDSPTSPDGNALTPTGGAIEVRMSFEDPGEQLRQETGDQIIRVRVTAVP